MSEDTPYGIAVGQQFHLEMDVDKSGSTVKSEPLRWTVYVYTCMATKTISITHEAYARLRARKGPNESFSDVILKLTERRPLTDFAGMLSKSSVDAIRKAIEESRRERRALDARR